MIDRREFLKIAGLTATWPYSGAWAQSSGVIVNDLHSQLNPTRVDRVVEPDSLDAARGAIAAAKGENRAVCIAGGRHAMGAQAFATDGVLVDIRKLDRALAFDMERGLIEVESGMQWPKLLDELTSAQRGRAKQWGFAQKQTGAGNRFPTKRPTHRTSRTLSKFAPRSSASRAALPTRSRARACARAP